MLLLNPLLFYVHSWWSAEVGTSKYSTPLMPALAVSKITSGALNTILLLNLHLSPPMLFQQLNDRKLKFWDLRQSTPIGGFELPERVYDLDVRNNLMVVATAGRHIIAYDITNEPREHSRRESPLKYQTRCISCFTDSTGFAVGSIEGRVGIHYLQKVPGRDSFAFKCHRQDNAVYSVNAICFNNNHGTFATVGSDGGVSFWDHGNKQRLKGFVNINRPIPCASFNAQGTMFAYASSYDWSKGSSFYAPGTPNEIYIHYTPEDEIKPKSKKTGFKTR